MLLLIANHVSGVHLPRRPELEHILDEEENLSCEHKLLLLLLFLTAVGLTPSGYSTVDIYTQTVHRNTQNGSYKTIKRKKCGNCGLCPVFAGYTLAFALQLRKKHVKNLS
jgi:hypothetical protein